MANWEAVRIVDVVSEIDDEKYVLPVIQRELVWTEDKMELLFDSILKGNSFGSIIVLEEEKKSEPLFAFRRFSLDGSPMVSRNVSELTQTQNFVIDGQQRLQTLYMGLKGSYFNKELFFDLYSDYGNNYDFEFSPDTNSLPKATKEDRPVKECGWYSAKDLLKKLKQTDDEDQVIDDLSKELNPTNDVQKNTHLKKNVKAFQKNILVSKCLGIAKVNVNKTLPALENRQKIVELFRRLNDGGTVLSAMDLVASTLKGFDYRMESFVREMVTSFSDLGLTPENLIKLIFLLQDNYKKEMVSAEALDAEFAINHRLRLMNTMLAVRKFLCEAKLINFYKNSNRSFVPLFFIAYHIFYKEEIADSKLQYYWDNSETSNVDFKPMKSWLYNSLLNGVFRSRGAGWIPYTTGVRQLLETIKKYRNKVFPEKELTDVYFINKLSFSLNYTEDNLDNLEKQFVFYLIYDRERQIRINDTDHIMPKNLLIEKINEIDKINSIKNYQLLDYATNRGNKNGKPFAEWVNNPEYVTDKTTYIKKHLIPEDESLWSEDRFLEFVKARGELILYKIKGYLA